MTALQKPSGKSVLYGSIGYVIGAILYRMAVHHRFPQWNDVGDYIGMALGFIAVTLIFDRWSRRRNARAQPSSVIQLDL